jgi:hypothetical protein
MVHLARVQGGQQIQTGDIWLIFRGFEFAAQRRNRVRGAVSGWALSSFYTHYIHGLTAFTFEPFLPQWCAIVKVYARPPCEWRVLPALDGNASGLCFKIEIG